MNNHRLYSVWSRAPINYYQEGVKKNRFQKLWHGRKIALVKELLKSTPFSRCLDIGCASGYMTSQIAKAFPTASYVGVDVYDKAIAYAKRQYPQIDFQVASAQTLPFGESSFDLILCYETIEHVEKPWQVLQEMKRVLSPNGRLILAMDSGSWLFRLIWFIWERTTGKVWQGAHLHPFHHQELERLIKKSGFTIEQKLFSHLGMEVVFVLEKGA